MVILFGVIETLLRGGGANHLSGHRKSSHSHEIKPSQQGRGGHHSQTRCIELLDLHGGAGRHLKQNLSGVLLKELASVYCLLTLSLINIEQ